MAALVEGSQYGLSSQGNYSKNKTLIFVKLTDSALRSIEEYLKYKVSRNSCFPRLVLLSRESSLLEAQNFSERCPSLFFVCSCFTRVPGIAGGQPQQQRFGFGVSTLEKDAPQGSFECVQQMGQRALESLGCLLHKMQIHASEDSYEKTRVKMAVVEQESKKNCTKVIKVTSPYVGESVLSVRPSGSPDPGALFPPQHRCLPLKRSHVVFSALTGRDNATSAGGHFSGILRSLETRWLCCHDAGRKVKVKRPQLTVPPRQSSSSPPRITFGKPVGQNHNSNPTPESRSGIVRRSYRERVIHLLALRPYKKPELLARLMKEGIKEQDRKGLTAVLGQVAVLKDNAYCLARHAWNQVCDDWPYYTPEEQELLKRHGSRGLRRDPFAFRMRPHNLTPPSENGHHSPPGLHATANSNGSGGNHHNHHHHSTPRTSPNGQVEQKWPPYRASFKRKVTSRWREKRNRTERRQCRGRTVRRQRISLCSTNGGGGGTTNGNGHSNNTNSSNTTSGTNGVLGSIRPPHSRVLAESNSGNQPCRTLPTNNPPSEPPMPFACHSIPDCPDSPDSRDSRDSRDSGDLQVPEYVTKYVEITNQEQRGRYKADFNAEYEEYKTLHSTVEQVSRRFSDLEDSLRNSREGSDQWNRIKQQIMREYEENKRDQRYQQTRRKFQYLHDKLAHIKRLVVDYDSRPVKSS
ncbi:unnamed protein product [Ixodes hexagonus]